MEKNVDWLQASMFRHRLVVGESSLHVRLILYIVNINTVFKYLELIINEQTAN